MATQPRTPSFGIVHFLMAAGCVGAIFLGGCTPRRCPGKGNRRREARDRPTSPPVSAKMAGASFSPDGKRLAVTASDGPWT
jgi:hypothetical protein